LVALSAEQVEHEQKHVEDVEQDAGGDHDGAVGTCSAQPVEVVDRERAEDPEPCDGVDDVNPTVTATNPMTWPNSARASRSIAWSSGAGPS
jgi:hypothetical protein